MCQHAGAYWQLSVVTVIISYPFLCLPVPPQRPIERARRYVIVATVNTQRHSCTILSDTILYLSYNYISTILFFIILYLSYNYTYTIPSYTILYLSYNYTNTILSYTILYLFYSLLYYTCTIPSYATLSYNYTIPILSYPYLFYTSVKPCVSATCALKTPDQCYLIKGYILPSSSGNVV